MKFVIDAEESFAIDLQKQARKKHVSAEEYILAILKTWMSGQMVFEGNLEAKKQN